MAESQSPTFVELGVAAEICDALADEGINRTFAIQELTLPLALDGTDIIGQARTGMGKTLGFGVPLIDRVFDDARIPEPDGTARAIIIVPTRELCVQVGEDLARAAHSTNLRVCTIYGGHPYEEQIEQLDRGVDIIVGTPGRLIDLYQRNNLELSGVKILVLDEADEMLDLGFLPDIEKILAAVPDERQTMLFSATMPGPILTLARTFMNRPVHIRAESGEEEATVHETTKQIVFQSHQMDKVSVIARILQANGRGRTIIFARTKRGAASVAEQLGERGFLVTAVHGDMGQPARERSLTAFRNGDVDVLVATDVAARGIDIDDVTHVINHQVPDDEMTYVHRIGRTGRAGHRGVAVTLVGWDETAKWKAISDALDLDMAEIPTWFSTSPELAEALDIPEGIDEKVGPARPVLGSRPPRGRGGRGPRNNRSQPHHRNRGQGRNSRRDGHSNSHRRR
ncbi:DEAD/DEAH box helicase [Corynebacterium sp. HMSC14H10]|uniref:DEAD/DEAH box helicase n=1 Tax=Corynebacterium sp. HMSC14H10 TaxID=1581103 RepID=UPI0008A1EAC0|nr:DEAD/DEAH box helicase [Corynebacterium sp. HMSC14H10]OFU59191.1 DEAD/DEAH box helicase [Corynebacterium sp. HMSC14H10]